VKNETSKYWIQLEDSAAIDIFENYSKAYGFWVHTGKEADYGNLIVKKEDKDAFLIIEVVDADKKVIEQALSIKQQPIIHIRATQKRKLYHTWCNRCKQKRLLG
jgi:hypothetical protein